MVNDTHLLQRYARTRDAEAFAELVRRYAGLVYGTCLRVLGNRDDAEDVTQECFLELARNAGAVTTSLPGWLHMLARSRAVDCIRRDAARRRCEEQAMTEAHGNPEPTWEEIAPHVDEALAALPDELRQPLLLHYLGGRTQQQVAAELGVNQSTVSRRLEKGLELLREHLREAGMVASVAVLAALLSEHAVTAAPATLLAALGKLTLAGIGQVGGATATAVTVPFLGTVLGKVILLLVACACILTGIATYRHYGNVTPRPSTPHGSAITRAGVLPSSISKQTTVAAPQAANILAHPPLSQASQPAGKEPPMAKTTTLNTGQAPMGMFDLVDNAVQKSERVHVLAQDFDTAERLTRSLIAGHGAKKISYLRAGMLSAYPTAFPDTLITVTTISDACFTYLRAEIAGQKERIAADRQLHRTLAIVVGVPASERLQPCMISRGEEILASIGIDDFLKKYRKVVELPGDIEQTGLATAHLSGNGMVEDSFCLALAEATRLLGRPVSYEALLALTTNAFAPGFDTGNDCKDLWVAEAWVSHLGSLQTACRYLGLSIEPLPFPEGDANVPRIRRESARMIREAMQQGKVVITTGGWENKKGAMVEPWWAGIVTKVKDDGTVLGAHPNGKTDNVLADLVRGEVFAVSLVPPAFDDNNINTVLLQQAIARIRARGASFTRQEYSAFGTDAMDDWITQMATVPFFCPPCQENKGSGWQSATTVARAVSHRCRIAAAYLREQQHAFPAAAQPDIEKAASHYERIERLLQPAIAGDGARSYRQLIGDLGKQKTHAETVLAPVKAEFAAAADAMAQALAAARAPIVLEDVAALAEQLGTVTVKEYRQTRGVMATRAICLQAAGCRDADYDTVMTVSGWGPAFAYHRTKHQFAYFGPFDPETQDRLLAHAFGREWKWTPRGDTPEATWQLIRQCIDNGTPVEGEHLNEILFIGYQDAEKPENRKLRICAPFDWKAAWMTWKEFTQWWNDFCGHGCLQYVGEKTPRVDGKAQAIECLRNIVDVVTNDGRANADFMGMKEGHYGPAGIEAFAADIADTKLTPDDFNAGWFGCHAILPQMAGRHAAAGYLWKVAGLFPEAVANRLLDAAGKYDLAYGAWREFDRQLGDPTNAASLDDIKAKWRQEDRRQAGAAAIRTALTQEQAAIAEITQALDTLGIGRLRREGGKVVIEGLENLDINSHNSVMCTSSAIMKTIGEDVPYDFLMGVSALAFRLQTYLPGWCPSSPHAHCGFNTGPLEEAALPYKLTWMGADKNNAAEVKKIRQAVAASIDRGIPVIYATEECGIIVGYEDGGNKWICRNYVPQGKGYQTVTDWPWCVGIFAEKQPVDRRKVLLTSLQTAVELAYTPNSNVYASGFAAYEAWINGLLDEKEIGTLNKDELSGKVHANAYCYHMLLDARSAAAPYLRGIAPEFREESRLHLLKAADLYEQITKSMLTRRDDLPLPWELYGWRLQGGAGWTPQMRKAQAGVLQELSALERQAISELRAVLDIEGVAVKLPARVDLTDLHLQGNGHYQDSFSLTIQAAAALFGKKVDYADVLALSTNGFAPGFCTGESCTAWWELYGRDRALPLIGSGLGLHIRKLLPEFEGEANPETLKHWNQTSAPIVQRALDSGAVVITDGGWQVTTPHGFVPWCWWGIVTAANADGAGFGATLNGRTDNPIEGYYSCWAITQRTPAEDPQQTNREMLRLAVARLRGEKPFTGDRVVYGLSGIDLWIAQMRKVPFCPDCKEQSWTCAQDTARTPYEDAGVMAAYLRRRADAFTAPTRPHLLAAADHYAAITVLLRPALTGEGGETFQQFIGDPARQAAYVPVLEKVKAEYAAIAGELEKALAVMPQ